MKPTTIPTTWERIFELKRLQQEIDEAEIRRRELILHYFGSEMQWTLNDEEIHRTSGELITEKQQRIKGIIEQL